MKIVFRFCCLLFFIFAGQAQQVQWANKIIKMPSDLGGKQYGIKKILGKPDAFPQGGDSPNAWSPKNAQNNREILEIGFEKPQKVKQVAVFENLNSGSIEEISVGDASGKYTVIWTRNSTWVAPKFRFKIMFGNGKNRKRKRGTTQEAPDVSFNPGVQIALLNTPIDNVERVKIKFNFTLTLGQKQIDAIGISDSDIPLEATINTRNSLENILKPEIINTGNLEAYSPIISFSGEKLFFTSDGTAFTDTDNFVEKIYSMTRNSVGNWINPIEETLQLNSNSKYNYVEAEYENFIVRGGSIYAMGSKESGFDLLENSSDFKKIETIKIIGFNNYNECSDFTITPDKKTILLAVESDFSQGGSDIYFATRKDDATYNLLQNAGKIINSAADESGLQLLSDQKTLLFASDGFSGFGSADIFVSQRLDDSWKNWSEPINLGNIINSTAFEGTPFYDEKNQILYYSTFENNKKVIKKVSLPITAILGN